MPMTIYEYAQAGHDGRNSEQPPYGSSTMGMAFTCGKWCKANGVTIQEIKASRGYSWIINRSIKLDFKNDDNNPKVTKI